MLGVFGELDDEVFSTADQLMKCWGDVADE